MITRRKLLIGGSLVALAAALGAADAIYRTKIMAVEPAVAQGGSNADILVPPALGDRVLGKDDAPVTVIEYASMTCSHCASFHATAYPELKKQYIDTGKVRFIFREFPLDPTAAGASMLARCADKDKFFPLIETLFQQQQHWAVQKPIPPLMAIAKQAGFSEQSFNTCLSNQKMLEDIQAEMKRASDKFGVRSTPTIFVNGQIVRDGSTFENLSKAIDAQLKS